MGLLKGTIKLLQELDEAVFPSGLYCLCCGSMIDRSRSYSLCDDCIRRFHWNTGSTCDKCGKALSEQDFSGSEETGTSGPGLAAGNPGADAVGAGCRPRFCFDCMRQMPVFTKGFSCLTYGLHERELMMDLKYAGRGYIARRCGDMMFDRILGEILEGCFSHGRSPIDMIVPVPVSDRRYRERGYNQSALMGDQLAKRWRGFGGGRAGAPVFYEELLFRSRETTKLRGLNPAERVLELEGVFRVRRKFADELEGAKVLLIEITRITWILTEMYILQGFSVTLRRISLYQNDPLPPRSYLRPGIP